MAAKKKSPAQNQQTVINGGEEIQINLADGTKETVKIRLLKISEFEKYLGVIDNEAKAAELLCDKPEGWADTLDIGSLLDIVDRGHEINFTNVYRWANRRADVNEAMLPLAQKGAAMRSALPNSAPTRP